jgi:hypothetical protein
LGNPFYLNCVKARAQPFVALGIQKVRSPTHIYVLLEHPGAAARVAQAIDFAGNAGGGLVETELRGKGLQAKVDALVERARSDERVACVACSDGKGGDAVGELRRRIVRLGVLPALERHFESATRAEDDPGAWLLTTIIAHTIEMKTNVEMLDAFLRTIELSLGRGDTTSTSQNLTATSNLLFYARKNASSSDVDAVLAKYPALDALRRLDDPRLWPKDAPHFDRDLACLAEQHARAAAQLGVQALGHHDTTKAQAESVVRAVLAVPGVRAHFAQAKEMNLQKAAKRFRIDVAG